MAIDLARFLDTSARQVGIGNKRSCPASIANLPGARRFRHADGCDLATPLIQHHIATAKLWHDVAAEADIA